MARLPPGQRGRPLDWGDDEAETRVQRDAASLSLIARDGPAHGHVFGSDGHALTIGRGGSCAVRLALSEISRRHALIRYHAGRYWIEDLGTLNGTSVNGQLIDKSTALKQGDRIRVGAQEFEVRFDRVDGRQVVYDGPNSDVATTLPPQQQASRGSAPQPQASRGWIPASGRPMSQRLVAMAAIGVLAVSTGALLAFAITRQSRRAAHDAAKPAATATRPPGSAATTPPNGATTSANAATATSAGTTAPLAATVRAHIEVDGAVAVAAPQAGSVAWAAARGTPVRSGDELMRVRCSNGAVQRELDRVNEKLEEDDSNPELARRAHALADELMAAPETVTVRSSFDGVVVAAPARGAHVPDRAADVRVARMVRLVVDESAIAGAGSACRVVFIDQKLDAEGRRVVGGAGATIELTRFAAKLSFENVGRVRADCK